MKRSTITRRVFALALLPAIVVPAAAWGAHASITLKIISPEETQEAAADREPPPGGANPRPRMTVKAGEPLILHYILTNVYPHGILKDVTVRYFIVRTGQFDAKEVPELKGLKEGVVTQGQATFDLKPKCRVGARLKFQIDEPGIYLVRVDTVNTKSDHEHFSAIDLEVK